MSIFEYDQEKHMRRNGRPPGKPAWRKAGALAIEEGRRFWSGRGKGTDSGGSDPEKACKGENCF